MLIEFLAFFSVLADLTSAAMFTTPKVICRSLRSQRCAQSESNASDREPFRNHLLLSITLSRAQHASLVIDISDDVCCIPK